MTIEQPARLRVVRPDESRSPATDLPSHLPTEFVREFLGFVMESVAPDTDLDRYTARCYADYVLRLAIPGGVRALDRLDPREPQLQPGPATCRAYLRRRLAGYADELRTAARGGGRA